MYNYWYIYILALWVHKWLIVIKVIILCTYCYSLRNPCSRELLNHENAVINYSFLIDIITYKNYFIWILYTKLRIMESKLLIKII